MFPNYFYYECLRYDKLFELENTTTKERQQFDQYNAENLLKNSNGEWKIPDNVPYGFNFTGLWFVSISEFCWAWLK